MLGATGPPDFDDFLGAKRTAVGPCRGNSGNRGLRQIGRLEYGRFGGPCAGVGVTLRRIVRRGEHTWLRLRRIGQFGRA